MLTVINMYRCDGWRESCLLLLGGLPPKGPELLTPEYRRIAAAISGEAVKGDGGRMGEGIRKYELHLNVSLKLPLYN